MKKNESIAVFAGGCFWCTEAIFNRLKGVKSVVSGYTGGFIKNPAYREVCNGTTGHAEGVKIIYDETIISYTQLLEVFFSTHDPTTLNRQGNDVGTQYRSSIFYTSEAQLMAARAYIETLEKESVFQGAIVTEIVKFDVFYEAEAYHHSYYDNNKEQPYCQLTIGPKIKKLNTYFKENLKH